MQPFDEVVPGAPSEASAAACEDALPDPSTLRPLDPRVMKVWRAAWLITAGLLALAALVSLVSGRGAVGAALLGLTATCVAAAVFLPSVRYRAWGFQVRPAGLLVRHGVVWRSVSVVPHARIQYVDTRRGPLERAFGLATVVVHTAGSRGAAVRIPGLDAVDAEALRDRLAALGDGDDAV
ncbi:MAG: PH domain-containing protein [bacterium]